ncbi:hypothetical protein G3N59_20770 [Paraburkholderia sp. Ac-20340]|uniref:hypothetical protein n=1 Tax=Paraburkholderia sp. Ac-20340 TaxID=2703888 RepID=UPI00197CD5AB|nr:hypothetical protein [Paraburkholderia sp. Ac-20340]MBN3855815.1 hypothetical protein [Paraburkholderia sp. Ac-20340]
MDCSVDCVAAGGIERCGIRVLAHAIDAIDAAFGADFLWLNAQRNALTTERKGKETPLMPVQALL